MKKITLFLCFSIVGLIGFAQQSESTLNIKDLSNQENSLSIKIDNIDFKDFNDKILLDANDFNMVNLVNNTHELTHNSNNSSSIENKYFGDAFSYNEYVLNIDIKLVIDAILKY
ncbi:MAG: hypothetical protein KAH72_11110 [Flavobacteriaceae bacterium]|nr:hypothetical protein [Flavobacteriaceae bacterium]